MEINDIRTLMTVLGFIGFIGIVLWAYGRGATRGFQLAQQLPFSDDAAAPAENDTKDRR